MTSIGITIALILAFIGIVWMAWEEWRNDLIRKDHQDCPEQSSERTRADLMNEWERMDVYLEGASCKKIANGLERDGILTSRGKTRWHDTTIRKILENEKYIGDALLQKTYTVDYLQKKRVKNTGIMPQYYIDVTAPN